MQNEEIIYIILMTFSGVMLLVILVLVVLKLASDKVNKEKLAHQEMAIKYQKAALKYSIEGQEKERRRLSAELHDGIISKLNVINLKIKVLEKVLNTESKFNLLSEVITKTIEDTRQISYDLMPVTLEKFGIVLALKELVEMNSNSQTTISFDSKHDSYNISKKHLIHIYRIIQELINNSLKHACCSNISFAISKESGFLIINYIDDGIGNKNNIKTVKGLGIRNIENRTNILGGKMALFNLAPGLRFEFKFPMDD